MTSVNKQIGLLENRIKELEQEIERLKEEKVFNIAAGITTAVPSSIKPYFDKAEEMVADYFSQLKIDPRKAAITIGDERYVLMRASSLSIDFMNMIKSLYSDKGEDEAIRIGQNFLFDISHVIGMEDARAFHKKMNLDKPVSKLSAGPVHFAYSGWSNVEILDSNPSPDENFYLKYSHPSSFEAEAWLKKGKISKVPVCIMNSGYSSGWCAESYGIPLTSVELTCRAKGDEKCTFIMAHPAKIQQYLEKENLYKANSDHLDIPLFFERKKVEQELRQSVKEKSVLLKEIHHRVKNNLQLISSLLSLQSNHLTDPASKFMFEETRNRIKAIALVHEKLYQSSDVEHVDMIEYIQSIVKSIRESLGSHQRIKLKIDPKIDAKITIDRALPCGLIINELISNSIKYGFPPESNHPGPEITVKVEKVEEKYTVAVSDNGIGLPENFSFDNTISLGFDIILSLIEQIGGTINYHTESGQGSTITITFS